MALSTCQTAASSQLPVPNVGARALAAAQASRRGDHLVPIRGRDNVHNGLAPLGVQSDTAAVRAHEEEVPGAQLFVSMGLPMRLELVVALVVV